MSGNNFFQRLFSASAPPPPGPDSGPGAGPPAEPSSGAGSASSSVTGPPPPQGATGPPQIQQQHPQPMGAPEASQPPPPDSPFHALLPMGVHAQGPPPPHPQHMMSPGQYGGPPQGMPQGMPMGHPYGHPPGLSPPPPGMMAMHPGFPMHHMPMGAQPGLMHMQPQHMPQPMHMPMHPQHPHMAMGPPPPQTQGQQQQPEHHPQQQQPQAGSGNRLLAMIGGTPSGSPAPSGPTAEESMSLDPAIASMGPGPPGAPPPMPTHSPAREAPLVTPSATPLPSAPPLPAAPSSLPSAFTPPPPARPLPPPSPSLRRTKWGVGRAVSGSSVVYRVDETPPGEAPPPQLEVAPITKYASEAVLALGRQVAVNERYVCYALRNACIRVLNINTALKVLLKGHSKAKRITDMAFSSHQEDLFASVGSDGMVLVRRLSEGPGTAGEEAIQEEVVLALQLQGPWSSQAQDDPRINPQLQWHPRMQDVLLVACGPFVVLIVVSEASAGLRERGQPASADNPLPVDLSAALGPEALPGSGTPADSLERLQMAGAPGVRAVRAHRTDIVSLQAAAPSATMFATPCLDGTVRVWGNGLQCLAELVPHGGAPVYTAAMLSPPAAQDNAASILLTAGPRNREIKLWAPQGAGGSEGAGKQWECVQTVRLLVGGEAAEEGAGERSPVALWEKVGAHKMFCHLNILHSLGLLVLADTPRQAIYVLHVEFGVAPGHARVSSLAQFLVTMPILSFTACLAPAPAEAEEEGGGYETFEGGPDGNSSGRADAKPGRVCLYCLQTASIQQYSLDLDMCLPPPSASAPPSAPIPAPTVPTPEPETSTASSPARAQLGQAKESADDSDTGAKATIAEEPSRMSSTEADSTAGAAAAADVSAQPDSAVQSAVESTVESAAPVGREGEGAPLAEGSGSGAELRDVEDRSDEPAGTPPPPPAASKPRLLTPQDLLSMASSPEDEAPSRAAGAPEAAEAAAAPASSSLPAPAPAPGSGSGSGPAAASSIFPSLLSPQALLSSFMAQGKGAAAPPAPAPLPAPEPPVKQQAAPASAKAGGAPEAPAAAGSSVGEAPSSKAAGKGPADAESEPSVAAPSGVATSTAEASGRAAAAPEASPKEPVTRPVSLPASFPPVPTFTKGAPVAPGAPPAGESNTQGTPAKGKKHRGPKEPPSGAPAVPSDVSQGAPPVAPAAGTAPPEGDGSGGLSRSGSSSSVAQEQPRTVVGPGAGAAAGVPPALGSSASSTSLLVHDADSASATQSLFTLAAPPASPASAESAPAALATLTRDVAALQQAVQQLLVLQRDAPKQLAVPVGKEGKRVEAAVGQKVDKLMRAHWEAQYARLQEEMLRREKGENQRTQQVVAAAGRDISLIVERTVKTQMGVIVASQLVPAFEASVSNSVQQLGATLGKQLEGQVQQSVQAAMQATMQDALRRCFAESVVPAVERATQAMLAQTEAALGASLKEHHEAVQQHLAQALAAHTAATVAAAASAAKEAGQPGWGGQPQAAQLNGLPHQALSLEHVEAALDPSIEISRLLEAKQYEAAITKVLTLADTAFLSWFCLQVSPTEVFGAGGQGAPGAAVSQGVVLSLLQQLGSDLSSNVESKVAWVREALLAVDVHDRRFSKHVRSILTDVATALHKQLERNKAAGGGRLASDIMVTIHLTNSLMQSCK